MPIDVTDHLEDMMQITSIHEAVAECNSHRHLKQFKFTPHQYHFYDSYRTTWLVRVTALDGYCYGYLKENTSS